MQFAKRDLERIRRVVENGPLSRPVAAAGSGTGECDRFEVSWGRYLGVQHVRMSGSGTAALYAGLIGLGVGPGDQVVVPAYGSISTSLAVLRCGAIPVLADVDQSLTLCPEDLERRLTKQTRAVVAVHVLGLPCDMRRIIAVARKHRLRIIENARQAAGGGYHGKSLGTFGHAGAFSFGSRSHLTCGEGGALVTDGTDVFERATAVLDFSDAGGDDSSGSYGVFGDNMRANELQAVILSTQLRRLAGRLARLRKRVEALVQAGSAVGLKSIDRRSPDDECGTHTGFLLNSRQSARDFARALRQRQVAAFCPADVQPDVFTGWEPVMRRQASRHPALDPYRFKANRKHAIEYHAIEYDENACRNTLNTLERVVLIRTETDTGSGRLAIPTETLAAAATSDLNSPGAAGSEDGT